MQSVPFYLELVSFRYICYEWELVPFRSRNLKMELIPLNQSWVYSGVALIPFQVYSRSGVDPDCSTPWSRIYAARLIPFHWSRGVSFYSGLLQSLNFSRQKVSDFFHP